MQKGCSKECAPVEFGSVLDELSDNGIEGLHTTRTGVSPLGSRRKRVARSDSASSRSMLVLCDNVAGSGAEDPETGNITLGIRERESPTVVKIQHAANSKKDNGPGPDLFMDSNTSDGADASDDEQNSDLLSSFGADQGITKGADKSCPTHNKDNGLDTDIFAGDYSSGSDESSDNERNLSSSNRQKAKGNGGMRYNLRSCPLEERKIAAQINAKATTSNIPRNSQIDAEDASDSEQEFDIYGCSSGEDDPDGPEVVVESVLSDDEFADSFDDSSSDDDATEEVEILEKESTIKVKIQDNDVPIAPATYVGEMPDKDYEYQPELTGVSKADAEVRQKITKLLNMGFHERSNENEAKRAMKLAQKLMRKHNLSQALLLQDRELLNEGSESLKGGLVAVTVKNRSSGKAFTFLSWFADLMAAINTSFEVKSFYSAHRGKKCKITFYGIYTNCQLAAYAFMVAAERISAMQAGFMPRRRSSATPMKAKLSYAMGIMAGILEEQEDEKDEEDETALVVFRKQNEKVQQDALRNAKVKLGRGQQANTTPNYDATSYETGKKDAKHINLAQRAIRDDWNKKVKKEKGGGFPASA